MKGVGDVVQAILLVLIMVIVFVLYFSLIHEEGEKEALTNLREAELLRAKNTMSLLNRSLAMTWYLSAVSSVFLTGDESIGCGDPDDPERTGSSINPDIDPLYWYQYDARTTKDDENNILNALQSGDKYYRQSPAICYPNSQHLIDWLDLKFAPIKELIEESVKEIEINKMTTKVSDLQNTFSLSNDGIASKTSQEVELRSSNVLIQTNLISRNIIYTVTEKMIDAGKNIVNVALLVSDSLRIEDGHFDRDLFYNDLRSNEIGFAPTANKDAYINGFSGFLEDKIGIATSGLNGVSIIKNILEFIPPDSSVSGVVGNRQGLVLHYKYTVTIFDTENVIPSDKIYDWPTQPVPIGSRRITSCFGNRDDPKPRFHGGLDIGAREQGVEGDTILAVAAGVVEKVISGCEKGDTSCGGNYGNYIIIAHNDGNKSLYGHLSGIIVEEGYNVFEGELIGYMGETGFSTNVHLHFEIRVPSDGIFRRANPCAYIDCSESTGKICTEMDATGSYYFHEEEFNEFVKRPFSIPVIIEDYLPAINCLDQPYGPLTGDPDQDIVIAQKNGLRLFSWNQPGDMVCCGNLFYVCSVNDLEDGPWNLQTGDTTTDCPALVLFGARSLECTQTGFKLRST